MTPAPETYAAAAARRGVTRARGRPARACGVGVPGAVRAVACAACRAAGGARTPVRPGGDRTRGAPRRRATLTAPSITTALPQTVLDRPAVLLTGLPNVHHHDPGPGATPPHTRKPHSQHFIDHGPARPRARQHAPCACAACSHTPHTSHPSMHTKSAFSASRTAASYTLPLERRARASQWLLCISSTLSSVALDLDATPVTRPGKGHGRACTRQTPKAPRKGPSAFIWMSS